VVDVKELAGAPGRFPSTNKAPDFWAELMKPLTDLENTTDREAIRRAADLVTIAYIGAGIALALVPVEGQFAAFAVGKSISDVMSPVLKRTLIDPIDAVLRQAFRTEAPSPRILLQLMAEGTITSEQLSDFIGDTEIADKYIPLLEAFTRTKQNEKAIGYEAQMATALAAHYTLPFDLLVARAEGALSKYTAQIEALDAEVQSIQDDDELRALNFFYSKLATATVNLETATTDANIAKYSNQVRVLIRRTSNYK
jgi:hypothetical protein